MYPESILIGRFEKSIGALLDFALAEVGAAGYAFYTLGPERRELTLKLARELKPRDPGLYRAEVSGKPLRILSPAGEALSLVTFTLGGDHALAGVLDFGFRPGAAYGVRERDILQRTADTVSGLLRRSQTPPALLHLVARLAELETGLADLKIFERARGLAEEAREDRLEVLNGHVANVLESLRVEDTLVAQLRELERQLNERRLVSDAKAVMQQRLQITEEEAYLRLRQASRRSRRRLADLAVAILDGSVDLTGLEQATAAA